MGIIAILSILSASAFISARDQAIVTDATEQLLSSLREAQNRAISVTRGGVDETKVWGVIIDKNNNNFSLVYLDPKQPDAQSDINYFVKETPNINPDIAIETEANGKIDIGNRYIWYASPFAKPYSTNWLCDGYAGDGSGDCYWSEINSVPYDWAPSGSYNHLINANSYVKITISYKNKSHNIRINSKGDVYIE